MVRRVNKGFQEAVIRRDLVRSGWSTDLVDTSALIDSRLSLGENRQAFKRYQAPVTQRRAPRSYALSRIELIMRAQEIHEARSPRAQYQDQRLRARKTFDSDTLTKKQFSKWKKNPERYDIREIDGKHY